jgi:hypothetical protein
MARLEERKHVHGGAKRKEMQVRSDEISSERRTKKQETDLKEIERFDQ